MHLSRFLGGWDLFSDASAWHLAYDPKKPCSPCVIKDDPDMISDIADDDPKGSGVSQDDHF